MPIIIAPGPLDRRYEAGRKLLNKWGFRESNERYFPYPKGPRREESPVYGIIYVLPEVRSMPDFFFHAG